MSALNQIELRLHALTGSIEEYHEMRVPHWTDTEGGKLFDKTRKEALGLIVENCLCVPTDIKVLLFALHAAAGNRAEEFVRQALDQVGFDDRTQQRIDDLERAEEEELEKKGKKIRDVPGQQKLFTRVK